MFLAKLFAIAIVVVVVELVLELAASVPAVVAIAAVVVVVATAVVVLIVVAGVEKQPEQTKRRSISFVWSRNKNKTAGNSLHQHLFNGNTINLVVVNIFKSRLDISAVERST